VATLAPPSSRPTSSGRVDLPQGLRHEVPPGRRSASGSWPADKHRLYNQPVDEAPQPIPDFQKQSRPTRRGRQDEDPQVQREVGGLRRVDVVAVIDAPTGCNSRPPQYQHKRDAIIGSVPLPGTSKSTGRSRRGSGYDQARITNEIYKNAAPSSARQ